MPATHWVRSTLKGKVTVGVVLTLVVFLVFKDGKDVTEARVRVLEPCCSLGERFREPVEGLMDGLRLAGTSKRWGTKDELIRRTMTSTAQKTFNEWLSNETYTRDEVLHDDPLVWSNLALGDVAAPVDLRSAMTSWLDGDTVEVKAEPGFVLRWARGGCRSSDQPFEVTRTSEGWRISKLPRELFDRAEPELGCDRTALRDSWVSTAPSTGQNLGDDDSMPAWAKDHLQRATPVNATASSHVDRGSIHGGPRKIFDPEDRSGPAEAITAWQTPKGSGRGAWINIDLGAAMHVGRIRLFNGVTNKAASRAYRRVGRASELTIASARGPVVVDLPDTPDRQTLDCDLGVLDRLTLRVSEVYPSDGLDTSESDVALSSIEVFGTPLRRSRPATSPVAGSSRRLWQEPDSADGPSPYYRCD